MSPLASRMMMKYLFANLSAYGHVGSPGGTDKVGYSSSYLCSLRRCFCSARLNPNVSQLVNATSLNNQPCAVTSPVHQGIPWLSVLYPYVQTGRWRGLLMTLCVTSKQCNQTLQT